jgi:hypothetical protein
MYLMSYRNHFKEYHTLNNVLSTISNEELHRRAHYLVVDRDLEEHDTELMRAICELVKQSVDLHEKRMKGDKNRPMTDLYNIIVLTPMVRAAPKQSELTE